MKTFLTILAVIAIAVKLGGMAVQELQSSMAQHQAAVEQSFEQR